MKKTFLRLFLVGAAAFLIYVPRLQDAPMYLSPDEVIISVDAYSLASTGHDVHGRFLPLYFQIQMPGESRTGWFMPMIFYFTALFLKVLPLSEWSVRLPTVLVGVTDIVLMYCLAKEIFESELLAASAAGLLALAPAHFILSRYGLDYVYPVPFVLAWLLCLVRFMKHEQPLTLLAGATLLGIGFYSYISAVVMMPLYLACTCAIALSHGRKSASLVSLTVAGFSLPLLLFAGWLIQHPTAFADTAQRYALYDASKLNVFQGMREFLSYPNLERLTSLYWSFLSPSFLFLSGDQHMMFSTRSVGIFLLPMAVLLLLGIHQVISHRLRSIDLVILFGFLTGPLAAVLVPETGAINRSVALLPFGVLLATLGIEYLRSVTIVKLPRWLFAVGVTTVGIGAIYAVWTMLTRSRLGGSTVMLLLAGAAMCALGRASGWKQPGLIMALCLLSLIPIQFGYFLADYFGDYRVRANSWLGGNLGGALEEMIERDRQERPPRLYFSPLSSTSGLLDIRNRWMDAYWNFYLIKHGRRELLGRTARLESWDVSAMPRGSLVLANVDAVGTDALVKAGELTTVKLIPEADRPPFFAILRR